MEEVSFKQSVKAAIGRIAFDIFLWAIGKTSEEYFSEIHRQEERVRKAKKRKQQRTNKQNLKNQTS